MQVKCPYPDCKYVGMMITKYHCKTEHGITFDEMVSKYGKPEQLDVDPQKLRKNMELYRGRRDIY